MPKRDLLGQRFGKLTVVGENPERTKINQVRWDCVCDCGETKTIVGVSLTAGLSKSCGCYKLEKIKERNEKHGHSHRGDVSPTYSRWHSLKRRCTDPTQDKRGNYYHRGIKVCDRWLESFENFLEDMGECPSPDHSLERIDVNGDYCPENCEWILLSRQAYNKRNTKIYEFDGKKLTLPEWEKETGINEGTLRSRLVDMGWSVEKALTTPANDFVCVLEYQGKSMTLAEWSKELGIDAGTLNARLKDYGWSVEKTLTTPKNGHYSTVEYLGEIKTIREWAETLGISRATLSARILNYGWSVEKAFTTPVRTAK
jgi:DNA-binding protein Fis